MNISKENLEMLVLAKSLKIDVKEILITPPIAWKLKNLESDGYATLGTLGNFSLVIGKAKSRKSFFINIAVSTAVSNKLVLGRFLGCLPKEQTKVLYFDTEQGKYHVQLALKRICKQIKIEEPSNLEVYYLRSKTPAERMQIIESLIYADDTIGFVVIDGIKDLVSSINDEEQATNVSSKLLKWTEERNIHILSVLHQNKSDNNARGHLGTELINKAETVLSVTKAEGDNEISIVEPQQCRNIEPEKFAFEIIEDLPVVAENFEARTETKKSGFDVLSIDTSKKYQLLKEVFSREKSNSYGDIVIQTKMAYKNTFKKDIGTNRVKELVTDFKNRGWLVQEKIKGPYSIGVFGDSIGLG
jgi:hypothetical protein